MSNIARQGYIPILLIYLDLSEYFQDIANDNSPGNLRNALNEVKSMLNTPIKVYEEMDPSNENSSTSQPGEDGDKDMKEGDFPGQVTRLMGKCKFIRNIRPFDSKERSL